MIPFGFRADGVTGFWGGDYNGVGCRPPWKWGTDVDNRAVRFNRNDKYRPSSCGAGKKTDGSSAKFALRISRPRKISSCSLFEPMVFVEVASTGAKVMQRGKNVPFLQQLQKLYDFFDVVFLRPNFNHRNSPSPPSLRGQLAAANPENTRRGANFTSGLSDGYKGQIPARATRRVQPGQLTKGGQRGCQRPTG